MLLEKKRKRFGDIGHLQLTHVGPALGPLAHFEQPFLLQDLNGFAHHPAARSELRLHLALAGQPLPRREPAVQDGRFQSQGDILAGATTLHGQEHLLMWDNWIHWYYLISKFYGNYRG